MCVYVSLSLYIYIYICVYIYVYIYITHMCIYTHTHYTHELSTEVGRWDLSLIIIVCFNVQNNNTETNT